VALQDRRASQGNRLNNFILDGDDWSTSITRTICGGSGADSEHNGQTPLHTHMTNFAGLNGPEILRVALFQSFMDRLQFVKDQAAPASIAAAMAWFGE